MLSLVFSLGPLSAAQVCDERPCLSHPLGALMVSGTPEPLRSVAMVMAICDKLSRSAEAMPGMRDARKGA